MPITMIQLECAICGSKFEKRKAEYDQRANKGFRDFYCGRKCHSSRASAALRRNSGACSVSECLQPQYKRKLCNQHYIRLRKYGDPLKTGRQIFATNEARFLAKVRKSAGCWIWTASRDPKYGLFRLNGKALKAHVVAYEWAHGPVPAGKEVCHKCDNPPCVRPDHLYAGTHAQNMQDAVRAGSMKKKAKSRHHC